MWYLFLKCFAWYQGKLKIFLIVCPFAIVVHGTTIHHMSHQNPQSAYSLISSVTRLGDSLHFGQLFKAYGNNYFPQIAQILGNVCKVVKIIHFAGDIIFCSTFIGIWQFFTGHTAYKGSITVRLNSCFAK